MTFEGKTAMGHRSDREGELRPAGLEELHIGPTDIAALIEGSLQDVHRPPVVTLVLTCDLAETLVWLDAASIRKVVIDLVTNAVEATPEGGEVRIGLAGDEQRVVITIADSGHGIAQADMDLLFIPFFSTKPPGEGTGLGLPRAYAAVKLHAGSIEVASNADPLLGPTGTRVTITLPRSQARPQKVGRLIIHED